MPQAYKKHEWPGKRPTCSQCGYEFGGINGKKRDLIYRRLLDYNPNGVPITDLLCEDCARPKLPENELVIAK